MIKARFKTQPAQQNTIGREYRRRLKKAFDSEGVRTGRRATPPSRAKRGSGRAGVMSSTAFTTRHSAVELQPKAKFGIG